MLVVDKDVSLMVTGLGDVIEPPDGVMAIGSGGGFALGAEGCCRCDCWIAFM
jgi:ATP-dependent HslUV protease, peptidase subunit HslV